MKTVAPRLVALIVAATLSWSVGAACLQAAGPTEPQMACCAGISNDCGSGGQPADCCTITPSPVQPFLALGKLAASRPDFVIATLSPVVTAPAIPPQAGRFAEASSPPDAKHPKYLLFSTLRL